MNRKPKYSIVMPTYNVSEYVQETVGCILAQSVSDWELICSDDASTDATVSILAELSRSERRIKLLQSVENSGGAYGPRVKAVESAKGEYVIPIDADDLVDVDFLKRMDEALRIHHSDIVIPEMWRFSASEAPYKILPKDDFDTSLLYEGKELVIHTLRGWKIPMAGFACRREIYLKAVREIKEEDKKSIHADELLSRWILFYSKSVSFVSARYLYRINPSSITHDYYRLIKSASTTNVGLTRMMSDRYGKDSAEYRLANEQLFFGVLDSLRRISMGHFDKHDKSELMHDIKIAFRHADKQSIKKDIGWLYRSIMSMPLPVARMVFKIIDSVKKR